MCSRPALLCKEGVPHERIAEPLFAPSPAVAQPCASRRRCGGGGTALPETVAQAGDERDEAVLRRAVEVNHIARVAGADDACAQFRREGIKLFNLPIRVRQFARLRPQPFGKARPCSDAAADHDRVVG